MDRLKNRLLGANVVGMFVLAYALMFGQGYAAPNTSTTAAAMTTTQFVREGRIGTFSGVYDLQFRLYDAPSGGSLVGGPNPNTVNDTLLDSGEYRVVLDFGAAAFTGDARYIDVSYRIGSSASTVPYTPAGRTAIWPNAYALSLRPGAVIQGSGSNASVRSANTGTGMGLWGSAISNTGIYGTSSSSNGVVGNSASGTGVYGKSGSGLGVYGESTNSEGVRGVGHNLNHAGIFGANTAGGYGVYGESGTGAGVVGKSTSWIGTYGESTSANGIHGKSTTGSGTVGESRDWVGVYGVSTNNEGVRGESRNAAHGGVVGLNTAGGTAVSGSSTGGIGVSGTSTNNPGVYGTSTNSNGVAGVIGNTNGAGVYASNTAGGYAIKAQGNASQNLAAGGFVKFMAFIDPYQPTDPIQQCYNSQLPGTQATSGDCGFTVDLGSGCNFDRKINFGAKVDDRFVVVTPLRNSSGDISAELMRGEANTLSVLTFYSSGGDNTGRFAEATCAKFFIIVY